MEKDLPRVRAAHTETFEKSKEKFHNLDIDKQLTTTSIALVIITFIRSVPIDRSLAHDHINPFRIWWSRGSRARLEDDGMLSGFGIGREG